MLTFLSLSEISGLITCAMIAQVRDIAALKKTAAVLLFLLVLHIVTSLYERRFWLNLADSEPIGLYKMEKFDGPIRRGDLIVMRVPAEFRPYIYGRHWLPEGWLLFKHVGAVSGDVYCVDTSLTINGQMVGPVYLADGEGHPLPRLQGCRRIPAGHFLPVATSIRHSFDGRYMGPVKVSGIEGTARPILTVP